MALEFLMILDRLPLLSRFGEKRLGNNEMVPCTSSRLAALSYRVISIENNNEKSTLNFTITREGQMYSITPGASQPTCYNAPILSLAEWNGYS
ncbi:hypothetical protein CEXT_395221 [Caerostris extrusa]|uniref:Uncharacterized protein n=1 Tax=Caerostris extrusa TaxID=172846 RepID=A0AAV4WAA9_CAEEX|nr:hypothetical protein CEXT_395221 [Caerostris extrusa]